MAPTVCLAASSHSRVAAAAAVAVVVAVHDAVVAGALDGDVAATSDRATDDRYCWRSSSSSRPPRRHSAAVARSRSMRWSTWIPRHLWSVADRTNRCAATAVRWQQPRRARRSIPGASRPRRCRQPEVQLAARPSERRSIALVAAQVPRASSEATRRTRTRPTRRPTRRCSRARSGRECWPMRGRRSATPIAARRQSSSSSRCRAV